MTSGVILSEQVVGDVATQPEYPLRQVGALRRWSGTISEPTAKAGGTSGSISPGWLSSDDRRRLLRELWEHRQALELKNDELRKVKAENEEYRMAADLSLDLTERKELEAEAIKNRNLESLGILAGGIAHDFNNLLQGLFGNLWLAKRSLPQASEALQLLAKAEKVYAQATKLSSQLLAFSTGGGSLRVDLHPAKYIREAVTEKLRGFDHALDFDLANDLWQVNVDQLQFCQVLDHMVSNAMDAMPWGGRLQVTAVNEQQPGGKLPNTLAPGKYVTISFQDQGCGIDKEVLPRIFDPYFSTKQRGSQKGMGLGLSLCNTIIGKHGGAITVETEPGKGSTFHLHLPAVTRASGKTASKRLQGGNDRSSE